LGVGESDERLAIPLLWKAANKHQEIVCVKFMEMLKQHLPLSNIDAVGFCGQHHKTLIKTRKNTMRELFARFGKGLGTRFAGQIGLIGEMGKNAFNSV
jgi:hypothetical protein